MTRRLACKIDENFAVGCVLQLYTTMEAGRANISVAVQNSAVGYFKGHCESVHGRLMAASLAANTLKIPKFDV